VDTSWRTIAFTLPDAFAKAPYGVEGLRVHVHDLSVAGLPEGAFDESSSPSAFAWKEPPNEALPQRWKGIGDFSIGAPPKAAPPREP